MRFVLTTLSLTLALVSVAVPAQENEARENARAAAIAAAKAAGKETTVSMEEPARSYFDWGAVIHPSGEIMSVRSGSVAAAMGLRTGDRLLQVDELKFSGQALTDIIAYLEGLEHGSEVTAVVARGEQTQTLAGTVVATVIPGWRLEVDVGNEQASIADSKACGRISVFATPPQTRDLYPAYFAEIDGENPPPRRSIIKLSPGTHVIELHELISDPWVRRKKGIQQAKAIEIDIKADTTYYLAAKFVREKRLSTFKEEYWEPVVWREIKQECEGD
ncbi:PDZ domain-containing protein [Pseudidiomarina sp.]|uniref:PDZ domain-containing protein n=1 Tax=Pseudidiomarina sp. TaxID=2081707 RepID=UPI003A974B19